MERYISSDERLAHFPYLSGHRIADAIIREAEAADHDGVHSATHIAALVAEFRRKRDFQDYLDNKYWPECVP